MTGRAVTGGVLAALLAAAADVPAGETPPAAPRFPPERTAAFSKQVERTLAGRGARVALVSRVGRDRRSLPAGIAFTHVAFAVYSVIRLADGRTVPGYAMHNLYQGRDDPRSSYLALDYPFDYYASVHLLEAGIVIPTPELQRRLLAVILSDGYAGLHNPRYSAISNPFDGDTQNCTEFVLDVINAAVYDTWDGDRIKANLARYFTPQPVDVGALDLLLASIVSPDISLSDHDGPVRTATFGSIARYLEAHGLADEVILVEEGRAVPD